MANQGVEVELLIIQNSFLHGIEIRKAVIRSSSLNYIHIHGSTISDSTLKKCKLFNCIIRDCSLTEYEVHETKIHSSSMDGCIVTTSPLALRKFPPEIREMIFQRCIDTRDNKSPSIIIALRGDKELYREAIKVFYKLNFFKLTWGTAPSCKFLSANTIGSIKKLLMRYANLKDRAVQRLTSGSHRGFHIGEQFHRSLRGSVKSLWLSRLSESRSLNWVQKCLCKFSTLKEFYLIFRSFTTDGSPHSLRRVEAAIHFANHHLRY
jgi:hypothetical protein